MSGQELEFDVKVTAGLPGSTGHCDLVVWEEEKGGWNREPGWYCRVFPRWGHDREPSPIIGPFQSYGAAMMEGQTRAKKMIEEKKGNT